MASSVFWLSGIPLYSLHILPCQQHLFAQNNLPSDCNLFLLMSHYLALITAVYIHCLFPIGYRGYVHKLIHLNKVTKKLQPHFNIERMGEFNDFFKEFQAMICHNLPKHFKALIK